MTHGKDPNQVIRDDELIGVRKLQGQKEKPHQRSPSAQSNQT